MAASSTADVIRIHKHGGPEELRFEKVELEAPGPGQVRLRQTAIGINFIDIYKRTGLYPGPTPAGLGEEAAGVVEALGEGVTGLKVGDRVVYSGVQGGYATHRNAPADRMVKIPDFVKDEDAAAVFLKGLTVWMLIFEIRRLNPGETIVVWAAAGGVVMVEAAGNPTLPGTASRRKWPRPHPWVCKGFDREQGYSGACKVNPTPAWPDFAPASKVRPRPIS